MRSFQKSPAAFVDGRGLLFLGEFVTSANVIALYNRGRHDMHRTEEECKCRVRQQY